uniref:Uncharacterized protein n=1 Tax=Globodera rostochiensis TaxID=31243 RepID=A0A914H0B3_GLORO
MRDCGAGSRKIPRGINPAPHSTLNRAALNRPALNRYDASNESHVHRSVCQFFSEKISNSEKYSGVIEVADHEYDIRFII